MAKRNLYCVSIAYPDSKFPAMDDKIQKSVGPCTGAGMGMGERDMDWIVPLNKAVSIFLKLSLMRSLKNLSLTKCEK